MPIPVLKSKPDRARLTGGSLDYEGRLGINRDLMDAIGMVPYERVLCGNMANGERFEPDAAPSRRGSGSIVLNDATTHLGKVSDLLPVMSSTEVDEHPAKPWKPRVLVPDEKKRGI